uniref:Uncharacterized protein n=1 Tax=Glossina pallidipes TaxID=7398 RepID=A0A1B0A1A5_GLOPL
MYFIEQTFSYFNHHSARLAGDVRNKMTRRKTFSSNSDHKSTITPLPTSLLKVTCGKFNRLFAASIEELVPIEQAVGGRATDAGCAAAGATIVRFVTLFALIHISSLAA